MNPIDILFIGNSYTGRNNLPELVTQLAAAHQLPVCAESILANGMSLKYHWDHGRALTAIQRQPWNFVVLQDQSTMPLKNRAKTHDYVERFDTEIRRCGARTALYLTWSRGNAPERQDELSDAYLSIGRRLGALVVPVGLAWQSAIRHHREINLYDSDGSHPSFAGSYLAACVFAGTLFGSSLLEATLPPLSLPTATAATLRTTAAQILAESTSPARTGV